MSAQPDFEAMFNAPDSFDETQLHPDLQPYVHEVDRVGRVLRHPLIYSLPPVAWRWVNASYEEKRKMLATYLAAGEWSRAIFIHERPWRMTRLDEYWMDMPDTIERNAALLEVWSDTEQPFQFGPVPLRLFTAARADRTLYLTDDDAGTKPILRGKLTVFRDTGIGEKPGIAWTLDRDKAVWFAKRFRDAADAILITATVDSSKVLAYIVGRGEQEVVVDPRRVLQVATERVR